MTARGANSNGFVPLYRDILTGPIIRDPGLCQLWVWLLAKTAYKKTVVMARTGRGFTPVTLQPGQIVFGRHATAAELGCRPSTLRNRLDALKRLGLVSQTCCPEDRQFSVVSVLNWDIYKAPPRKVGQPKDRQPDRQQDRQTFRQLLETQSESAPDSQKVDRQPDRQQDTKQKTIKQGNNVRPAVGRRPSYRDVNGREMPWIGSDA